MASDFASLLEKARRQLLDASTRNRLLSIPQHSRAKLVHVVDELSDEVFRILCREKRRFTFVQAPERSDGSHESDEKQPVCETALGQPEGEDADDLDDRGVASRHRDTRLQTALGSEALQRRLLSLYYDARTAIEETGVNTLFLTLGQLKWRDDRTSDIDRYAPLLLVPVKLEREGARSKFKLSALEPEAAENLSLKAKLQSMGIRVPEWSPEDEVNPSDYFSAIADAVSEQPEWEVLQNRIGIGFFSFSKFLMHRDLDPEVWPDDAALESHELVSKLMGDGFPPTDPLIPQDANLDAVVPVERLNHVIDADSSQAIAIEEIRAGRNLIIQGPPGTGKSQTITNLIATAVLDGKTVLFVAEKMAALDVVKRRLDALGLDPLALELHSHRSDKKGVLNELERTLQLGKPKLRSGVQTIQELAEIREKLNTHAAALNRRREPSGLSAIYAMGRLCQLEDDGVCDELPEFDGALEWTPAEFQERKKLIQELATRVREIGHPSRHPWRGATRTVISKFEAAAVARCLLEVRSFFNRLLESLSELAGSAGEEIPVNLGSVGGLLKRAQLIADAPVLDSRSLDNPAWQRETSLLRGLAAVGRTAEEARQGAGDRFIEAAWSADVGGLRRAITVHGRSILRVFNPGYRRAMAEFRSYLRDGKLPKRHDERLSLVDALGTAEALRREVGEHGEKADGAFGALWDGVRSDWAGLDAIIDWVENVRGSTDAGDDLLARIAGTELRRDGCRDDTSAVSEAVAAFEAAMAGLAGMIQLDCRAAFGAGDLDELPLEDLARRLDAWEAGFESLHAWVIYWNRVVRCGELGIGVVPARIADGSLAAEDAAEAFEFGYLRKLCVAFGEETPTLAEFDGLSHSQLVEEFREIDLKRIDLARQEVMLKHYEGLPHVDGNSLGALATLRGEMARKKGHMAIRKLLAQTGEAVKAIKPVFMMSPMSVAQFLQPGSIQFDLVIFDEASQIEPVDALGAIARARRIAVVGDDKQLPPSRFFASMGIEMEEEEDEDAMAGAGDMESLLGLANAKGMLPRMLHWHYRSRHGSLIAVSNHEFYDDKLFIVPSPLREPDSVGLFYHHIADGVFDRGRSQRNAREAKVVAARVMDYAASCPEKSLGVGAFSAAQRDAILDELELLRRERPEMEQFFHSHEYEPFFVKNLENLQGDERDVIYISVGYGRDESGFFGMNFGPLNREGGERRLNVLITRAKERCEVFASIHADEIDLNRSRTTGVAALKTFLQYAETGILGVPDPDKNRGVESPFEQSVKRAIEGMGYEVHPQVGTAGFFIDLAVVDPEQPARYLLGIECDGASYHSARSARERDRQRQEVLEDHGWRIHRIWSADWFLQPKKQLEHVLEAIERARCGIDGNIDFTAPGSDPPMVEEPVERHPEPPSDRSPPIERYHEATYDLRNTLQIHEITKQRMAELVLHVLEVEAPIHAAELTTRIRSFWGLERSGSRVRDSVWNAVNLLRQRGHVELERQFLRLPGKEIVVRDRSQVASTSLRKPEMLPPAEVRAAIELLVERNHAITPKEAAVGVARLFGFRSTSQQLRSLVDAAIGDLIGDRVLDDSGEYLKRSVER